jgi:hypothetical protein
MGANPLHRTGWESTSILPTVHEFVAGTEDAYTIDIAVDGKGYTVPVIVAVGPPPPTP